jgi:hypothetical protein
MQASPHNGTGADHAPVMRIRLEWADLAVGSALLAVAVWFLVQSLSLEDFSGTAIGSADFPRGVAALLAFGVAVLLASAGWRLAHHLRAHEITVRRPWRVVAGMAMLLAFPFAMSRLGYYPTMAVWLAAFFWLADYRRPVAVIACVAGFLAFTKIVFEYLLSTPIP